MHVFTITIHSNLFGQEFKDEVLENMAFEFRIEFLRLLKKHKLDKQFKVETFWSRGSLVEQFVLLLQNPEMVTLFGSVGSYKVLKEYKSLRENVLLMSSDLKSFSIKVSGVFVSVKDIFVCDTKPSNNSKKLKDK